MKEIPLNDFLGADTANQKGLAMALGVTQSAISQMAASGREILVQLHHDGRLTAYERRPIPVRRAVCKGSADSGETLSPEPAGRQSVDSAVVLSSTAEVSHG